VDGPIPGNYHHNNITVAAQHNKQGQQQGLYAHAKLIHV
jgi:hypothetical protein